MKGAREKIIQIAAQSFAQNGYDGTSTREITAKAGVNLSSISYYFGGKEGLFKAVIEECFKPILTFIDTMEGNPSGIACLKGYLNFAYAYIHNQTYGRFVLWLLSAPHSFRAFVVANYMSRVFSFLKGCMQKGKDCGELRADLDIESACLMFVGMINFYILNQDNIQMLLHPQLAATKPAARKSAHKKDAKEVAYFEYMIEIFLQGAGTNR
ncbi:TetR/AcrR family transcriptional regulator [Helicobacter jaachi]|uniref:TetR/AcrR family transcriptional regulator n=1 Tax=Helicobacter jaachi TaxID=1677920 RepID=A0A4U8TDQ8_9HELI|nr:TetR family transcriptional regulator [Helicobacter jaachi]TLD96797.1 TetR/AcrR family transcriptional regulator [Helicobacter jaachi]